MRHGHFLIWLVASGCSPFGNQSEPTELFPQDSLSRTVASEIATTELTLERRVVAYGSTYFSSMLLAKEDQIWVTELLSGEVWTFNLDGDSTGALGLQNLDYPYFAGRSGDAVALFSAGSGEIRFVTQVDEDIGIAIEPAPALPDGNESSSLSRFVLVVDSVVYVRETDDTGRPQITVVDAAGTVITKVLPGGAWRYHGVFREWRGRAAASSSYRPVLYFFDPEAAFDSLYLTGFDSPMLARSRSFSLGETEEPPLMISGFRPVGDHLFVLNVRPGILRIDDYDVDGQLVAVYERESPKPDAFTPVDLVVVNGSGPTPTFFVISTSAVYHSLSLTYQSRLDILTPR